MSWQRKKDILYVVLRRMLQSVSLLFDKIVCLEVKQQCEEAEINEIVKKPIEFSQLQQLV